MKTKLISILLLLIIATPSFAAKDDTTTITAGVFTFEIPQDWTLAPESDQQSVRKEIESGLQQMISQYNSSSEQSLVYYGIQTLKAIRLPNKAGWFVAHTLRIPDQADYLTTMQRDQAERIRWGKQQGIVTKANKHGIVEINGRKMIKVDTEMSQGARSIALYYWSEDQPGIVGTIQAAINPGHYSKIEASLKSTLESLHVALSFKVDGRLIELPLSEGERVKQGQLMAKIDDRDYQLQLDSAKADLEYAKLKLERAKIDGKKTEISKMESAFAKASYELNIAAKTLENTALFAPYDGIVLGTHVEEFESIKAGQPILVIEQDSAETNSLAVDQKKDKGK